MHREERRQEVLYKKHIKRNDQAVCLNHERLAAATFFLDVGVAENESSAQLVLLPVHFAADNTEQSLAVDEDLDAVLLDYLIELSRLLHVLQVIGETRAATVLDTDSNILGLRLCHQLAKLLDGQCGQFHGGLSWPERPTGFRGSLGGGRRSGSRLGFLRLAFP